MVRLGQLVCLGDVRIAESPFILLMFMNEEFYIMFAYMGKKITSILPWVEKPCLAWKTLFHPYCLKFEPHVKVYGIEAFL